MTIIAAHIISDTDHVALDAAMTALCLQGYEPLGAPYAYGGRHYWAYTSGSASGDTALLSAVAGTPTASKALILDANVNAGALKVTSLAVGASGSEVVIGATPAEIDLAANLSAQTETIAAAGAVSAVKRISKLALVGAGAVTLAAPNAAMLGAVKVIEMTTDNGDVTLALTNVTGHTGETATFNDVGDTLVLVGGVSKWIYVSASASVA